MSNPSPKASVPGRLLATLLSQNNLVQPEVALTRATCFLLRLPGANSALDVLLERSGVSPEAGGHWRTEVRGEEGGRTDLEYRWGEVETPRVIVEAKIGHTLDAGQLSAYRSRLGDEGMLVVLLPVTRRQKGERVVEELRAEYAQNGDRVEVALWTWDEVAAALESALPDSHDVIQLRGLIDVAGALDILPFDEPELRTSDASRFEDLWKILDRASWRLFDRPYRMLSDGRGFERYRYVTVDAFDAEFVVGIGRQRRTEAEPWVWVRIPDDVHLGIAQQEAIKRHRADVVRDGEGLAFPLQLEPGLSGVELTESLRSQLEEAALQIREGLRESFAAIDASEMPVDDKVLAPLIGMPPFSGADLLDSSSERRRDIDRVVKQVLRHAVPERQVRHYVSEPFSERYWFVVQPYTTYLSIGVERTDTPGVLQPWAWLSVHNVTPRAEEAADALRAAFPQQVVEIPAGWGLPLNIPQGATGVQAFEAVVAQVEHAKSALREALSTSDNPQP